MTPQTIDLHVNPSEETIRLGPLTVRFLVTAENSSHSIAAFEVIPHKYCRVFTPFDSEFGAMATQPPVRLCVTGSTISPKPDSDRIHGNFTETAQSWCSNSLGGTPNDLDNHYRRIFGHHCFFRLRVPSLFPERPNSRRTQKNRTAGTRNADIQAESREGQAGTH